MDLLKIIIEFIAQGGSAAVIVILSVAIGVLIWDRRTLVKTLSDTTQKVFDAKDKQNESIKEILDRYHRGNVDLITALNEIKNVLITIQMASRK